MPTLTWVGKDKVVNHHLDVPFRVLQRESHFDAPDGSPANSSDNRIIHGDNLAALKSLLPEFEGKINCIYIDPPYNTGNESWVYNDAVNDPKIKKWLGQVVGKEGEDLSRHDKWLCMMYPRLKLLHRLLAKDGFIFVSIDVFEFAYLKPIMDEIFGAQNFRNCISVKRGIKNVQSQFEALQALSVGHEYIFLYSKKPDKKLPKLSKKHDEIKAGKWDTFWRGTDRPTMRYELLGIKPERGQWRWEQGRATRAVKNYEDFLTKSSDNLSLDEFFLDYLQATNDKLDFVRLSGDGVVQYYVPPQEGKLASDNWMDITLSGSFTNFDTEKNVCLLDRIVEWITHDNPNAIILDSFAGSGTTAHAVLKLNAQDQGNRRFILIEMEDYADTITAERVRRVMSGYGEGNKQTAGLGGSFDYYTIGAAIFNADDTLNEAVGVAVIRDYVSYSEGIATEYRTPQHKRETLTASPSKDWQLYTPYLLGLSPETAWIFYYEADAVTCLDLDFLGTLKFGANKPATAIIYADKCLFNKEFLTKHGIIFKKIPRDITRF
ncbi:MAG: site-specific DNA-methyltransferase [Methylococcales bacterium]